MVRRPVWVRWHDAAHIAPGEWATDADLKDTNVTVHTVGILVRKTKAHLIIAHSLDSGGLVTGTFSIPRTAVEDWGELRE
jgi:hypothetical protein